MKYAVIDIGSNTVRLNIYMQDTEGKIHSLLSKKHVAGLASYVEEGYLTQKGADKLVRILQTFAGICQTFGIDQVYAFATASLRNVENSEEIISYVEPLTGLQIELVSGEEEAKYGYLGIQHDYQIGEGYIVDIGGGSCELTLVQNQEISFAQSLPAGSLSLYKKFCSQLLPNPSEAKKIRKFVKGLLVQSGLPLAKSKLPIYGVGGTLRAAGNLSQEYFDLPSHQQLSHKHIKTLCKALLEGESTARQVLLQVSPERVHTICPGMLILLTILSYTGAHEIYISDKGIREGLLSSRLGPQA